VLLGYLNLKIALIRCVEEFLLSPRTKFNRVVTCIFDVNCGVGEFFICEQEGVLRNLVKKKHLILINKTSKKFVFIKMGFVVFVQQSHKIHTIILLKKGFRCVG
jgi:hypothetical protein